MPAADTNDQAALSALYQELILDHYRRPRNKGALEAADVAAERRNPLCGDEIVLQLAFDGDRVREARFTGRGCSISQASASMMTQAVKGKSREEAERLFGEFHRMVTGELDEEREENSLGRLKIFAGVREYPARVKCASLAWHTLHAALAGDGAATTEDLGPDITSEQMSA